MERGEILHYEEINLAKLIKNDDRYINKEYIDRIHLFKNILEDRVKTHNVQVVAFEEPTPLTADRRGNGRLSERQISVFGKLKEALGAYKVMLIDMDILYDTFLPSEWRKGKKLGRERIEMKKNAIIQVNEKYGLDLKWFSDSSQKNEDDVAESVLIAEFLDKKINK